MRDRNQVVLPINLGICIPEGDHVFKVAEICESLDYTELFNTYLRNWRKVNPITMFEILVFGYMERKFSSYAIEKACHTDIRFMWLLEGEPTPSVATIKRFQSEKLSEAIEGLFYQLSPLPLLEPELEQGVIAEVLYSSIVAFRYAI